MTREARGWENTSMGRTPVAAALSVAAVLLGAAPAGAATHVGFPLAPGESAQVAVIAATDGTANNIVVQRDVVDGVEAIRVTDNGDTVAKVQPQDSCTVAPDQHTITCTLPAVSVFFGTTAVTLNGGNDRLNVLDGVRTNAGGGPGNDVVIGSSADDLLNGESGDDRVEGRGGNDQIDLPQAARDFDYGNDTLVGGEGDDFITDSSTGYGDDTIDPGLGRDTVGGGAGTDTLTYANSPQRVEIVIPHPGASAPAGSDVVGSVRRELHRQPGSQTPSPSRPATTRWTARPGTTCCAGTPPSSTAVSATTASKGATAGSGCSAVRVPTR